MYTDGSAFIKRAHIFQQELQNETAPNAQSLARLAGCSVSTARRTISRLRDEYFFPIIYDQERRGYFLTDKNFKFEALPPGRDELAAVFFMRLLADQLGDDGLILATDRLWHQFSSHSSLAHAELQTLTRCFTADFSEVGLLADASVFQFLRAAGAGDDLELVYKSPWKHTEQVTYQGRILQLHLMDGRLYIEFLDITGKERILNTSFVKRLNLLQTPLTYSTPTTSENSGKWLSGFGVWAGEELYDVELRIASPASEYYAKQHWDETQEDSWDGDILVRSMKSMHSPELIRRLLSLGKYLIGVKPVELQEKVVGELRLALTRLTD